jgi:hypothetical protein
VSALTSDGRLQHPSFTCSKIASLSTVLCAYLTIHSSQSITVEKETPLEVDPGFLSVTDLNPIDEESYKSVPQKSFSIK